jgi:hypothetical protein
MVVLDRALRLSSLGGVIDIDTAGRRTSDFAAITAMRGIGMPLLDVRWNHGAGPGAVPGGTRVLERDLSIALMVNGSDESSLLANLSALSKVLDERNAPLKVTYTVAGVAWLLEDVRHQDGGQWSVGDAAESDGRTYVIPTPLVIRAGSPYWVRSTADQVVLQADAEVRGLLDGNSLSELRLSSSNVINDAEIDNTGDAPTFPLIVLEGPATSYVGTSPRSEVISWEGVLAVGERRIFDHEAKTVVDETGADRYTELGDVPRFWPLSPGTQTTGFAVAGTTTASKLTVSWRPRRNGLI